ncbi:MAG: hypothetical protein H0W63_03865 [Gemmatimonadaceae bacterium]|nr:hypothetical protein [Gemmatimonadaceae bacterium]
MANTITPRQIITRAVAKSVKSTVLNQTTEGLDRVKQIVRTMFVIAARVNPEFFVGSATVAHDAGIGGWAVPDSAEAVFFVGTTRTGECAILTFADRTMEAGVKASVYRFGQKFNTPGGTLDPNAADSAVMYYSRRPTDPVGLDNAIDGDFPVNHNQLLIDEMAVYLAIKDGRPDDIELFKQDRDNSLKLFVAHMEHATLGVRMRYRGQRDLHTNSIIALSSLLAGGTSVPLPG